MRTFITGATGFIGAHAVRRLREAQHDVCCLVRKGSDSSHLVGMGAEVVTGDVTDRDSVMCGMRGNDWVVNLAACTSPWHPDKQVFVDVNVGGAINVLESALETGVSKVVQVAPAAARCQADVGESSERKPQDLVRSGRHIGTKGTADVLARELCERKGLPLVSVYPGCVIGPGDSRPSNAYRESIRVAEAAMMRDDSVLTLVHVRDVAAAIVHALEKEGNVGESYLIGHHQLSYRELDELITDIGGVASPARRLPFCVVRAIASLLAGNGMRFDGGKAERELGVSYASIRDALDEAMAYHDEAIRRNEGIAVHDSPARDGIFVNGGQGIRVLESIPSYDGWS